MAKHNIENICWREMVWQRPYKQEQVVEMFAHLAVLTPRGSIIWEARGQGGIVRHLIGEDERYIDKIEATIKIHGNISLYPIEEHLRKPVTICKQLAVSHTGLSLNTDVTASTVRSGLASLITDDNHSERVVQVVLGGSFTPKPTPKNIPNPNSSWLHNILYDDRAFC